MDMIDLVYNLWPSFEAKYHWNIISLHKNEIKVLSNSDYMYILLHSLTLA